MTTLLRALAHALLHKHHVWSDHMYWSGSDARVYFCHDCPTQFWPLSGGPYADYHDNPVIREPGTGSLWLRWPKERR